jgi:4'-phosphopantetheinyl transferase
MEKREPTSLQEDAVHVWRFSLISSRQEQTAIRHWLDPLQQDAINRLVSPRERGTRIVAWGRLRFILSRYLRCAPEEIRMERLPDGRPIVVSPETPRLQFSLAHSGSLGLVAVSVNDVGVDIEAVRVTANVDRLAARFYAPAEVEELQRSPQPERTQEFFRLWVLKEAYLKSIGRGVPAGLSKCVIASRSGGPHVVLRTDFDGAHGQRVLAEIPVSKGYVAALSFAHRGAVASVFDL